MTWKNSQRGADDELPGAAQGHGSDHQCARFLFGVIKCSRVRVMASQPCEYTKTNTLYTSGGASGVTDYLHDTLEEVQHKEQHNELCSLTCEGQPSGALCSLGLPCTVTR